MKANELMIGDWVMTPYGPHKIDILYGDYGKVQADLIELDYSEIQPIPLTAEILEKNGFEHEENAGYVWDNGRGIIVAYSTFISRLRIIKDLNILFDSQDYSYVYVHTLQHALRLCGFEKEIVI